MHAPHVMDMNTPMIRKTLVAALMLALCGTAGAAGLGRINVMSTLGQPLRAEIELSASSDELDNMVVRMASADAYRRAGIDYVSALTSLKTAVEKRGNRAVVKVSSDRAFNEPFLDMLVDVTWAGGHLQREYTVLLDPEELPGPKTLNATAPISNPLESNLGGRSSQQATAPSRSPVESQSPSRDAALGGSQPGSGADEYTVKKGDTLAKISSSLKSGEVTQDQMMAALYRSNSDAFVGGNINRMRVGRILKVPDSATVEDIKPREARQIILKAHNFEGYRRAVADAAPMRDRSTGQSGQGKVASKVVEQASDAPAKDKVTVTATSNATPKASKIKAAPAGAADSAANQARLQALIDENASHQKELQEAKSRISELEQNIKEQKKLLDMKSDALAQAEARAKTASADAAKKAPAPAAETQQAPAPAQPPVQESPAPAPASAPAEGEAAASAPEAAPAVESAPPAQIQSAPAPKPVAAPKPAAEDEDDGSIFSNYWTLGLAGLVLALFGIGYVAVKQRRKQASYGTGNTQLSETSTTSPNSVFGNAGGQIVDTGGTSLLHTDFSQSGMASIDTDEGVDPVAEADVYMAYGRDAQAEEILLDALKNDPRRTAVYVKLLEIYAQRRSLKQFENTATDLYTQTGGAGDDWAKAAALGLKLDPSNPLYKGAGNGGGAGLGNELAAAPQAVTAAAPKPAAVPPAIPPASNVPPVRSTWTTPADVAQVSAAAPGAMPVIPEPVEEPLPESVNLDFNLDLDAPSEDDEPTQAQFGASAKEDDDLPMMEQAVATDPMGLPPVSTSSPLEFDLGFDSKSPASATTTAGVDTPQSFGTETEFDIGIETDGGHSALSEVDLEKTNFEGSLLDFDFELGDEDDKSAVDLSDVSLNAAPEPVAKPAAAPAPKPAPASSAAPAAPAQQVAKPAAMEPIQDHIDVDEEIATKLELAKAYEEMGDVEGARELLEEVLNDGANVQKEQAKTMLSRLG
jgi:pilus assembly protein FimV